MQGEGQTRQVGTPLTGHAAVTYAVSAGCWVTPLHLWKWLWGALCSSQDSKGKCDNGDTLNGHVWRQCGRGRREGLLVHPLAQLVAGQFILSGPECFLPLCAVACARICRCSGAQIAGSLGRGRGWTPLPRAFLSKPSLPGVPPRGAAARLSGRRLTRRELIPGALAPLGNGRQDTRPGGPLCLQPIRSLKGCWPRRLPSVWLSRAEAGAQGPVPAPVAEPPGPRRSNARPNP